MARRRPRSATYVVFTAVAVPLLALFVYFVRLEIVEYVANQQMQRTLAAIEQMQANQTQRTAVAQQKQIAVVRERQQINQQYIHDQQIRQESEYAKQQAWYAYYQEPKACSNWRTDAQMVACVDQKSVAKREFERMWEAGEIGEGVVR